MKALKLNVYYSRYYGGDDIDEFVLLPLDVNGVLFDTIGEEKLLQVVSLGELEGKHSDCHGDLHAEIIDLDKLGIKEASDLVYNSNFDIFESFFEGKECDFSEHDEYDEVKVNDVLNKFDVNIDSWEIQTELIHNVFIEKLKDKYVKSFKSITVLEEDYDKVNNLIKNEGIKVFL